ncbi:oxidoreductase [Prochlorococcus marinus str. XMU1419]|nr:oxidoreductase [Prochlorococcus marinus str. XMU1419]
MNMKEEKKINIALIGCGRISRNHIKSIFVHKKLAKLVAICDCDSEKINNAKELINNCIEQEQIEKYKIHEFTSDKGLFEFIKRKLIKIDLVVLATPSGMHPQQVFQAAEANVNVCTEKPMATKWDDGLKMVSICKKKGVKLFVVKQNRFNKTIDLVRKQIHQGRFGKLGLISVNVFWQRPQSYYDQDEWRGTLELDGGALMNQASHYVDLLEWMIGPVKSINASIATIARNIEAEDTAAIKLKWENGALGTMSVTMIAYPQNLEGSITILGDEGSVKIGGKAVNKIETWEFKNPHPDDQLVDKASYETSNVYGFGHPLYYENMLKSIKGECEPICSGEEGLKSLQLLVAAYKSAKLEKDIYLPLSD